LSKGEDREAAFSKVRIERQPAQRLVWRGCLFKGVDREAASHGKFIEVVCLKINIERQPVPI
jgi:hypothetical protein